jgi:hypothetical protein
MKKFFHILLAVLAIAAIGGNAQAQTLEERLQKFGTDYAKGYVGPFGEAFGAALSTGWYHNADISTGIDVYVGLKVMLMPIPDDSKTFKMVSPWNQTVQEVPTVFGDQQVPISGAPSGVEPSVYPGGYNLTWSPMLTPHISVGNIFGTRLMLRFLPEISLGDYGKFSMFGIGVQHSISQYIPLVPLEFSAMIAYQKFSLGDLISAHAFTFGVQASKSFAILTVYGGLAYESSTFSFSYTAKFTDPLNPTLTKSVPVGFDIDGKNSVRATVGFAVSLGFVKINADYSLAAQSVASAGIGVGI